MNPRIHPICPPEVPFPEPERIPALADISVPLVEAPSAETIPFRAYAAIQLRVADSGIEWLDDMIRRSRELDRLK